MWRKFARRRWIPVVLVFALVIGIGGYVAWRQIDHDGPNVTTVTPTEGGKLSVGGVTVTVPPGAVKREVKLSVTPPKWEKPSAAPLDRMASKMLSFDITLDDGRVTKPSKPLTLTVDAKRHFPDASAEQLWLFTPQKGKGSLRAFERVGITVKNDQLTAQLPHLSPFQIVLPEPPKWMRETVNRVGQNLSDFGRWSAENVLPEGLGKRPPKDCQYNLEVGGTKVNLTSDQNSGWKRGTGDTPIHACLKQKGGGVSVELVNNSLPYWAARSSSGVKFSNEFEGTTTELTRLLLEKVIREPGVKGYLARQGKLSARLPGLADARIHLETDMGVFHAEELAIVVSLLGDALGLQGGALKALLEVESVTSCLRDSVEFGGGGTIADQLTRLYGVVASKCGEVIFEVLGYAAPIPNAFAVAGTIFEAGVGLVAGAESAIRKLDRPIVVYVAVERCIEEGEFKTMYPHAETIHQIVCGGKYAAVRHDSTLPNLVYILERNGSGWDLVYANEGVADPPPCGRVPSNVGSLIGC